MGKEALGACGQLYLSQVTFSEHVKIREKYPYTGRGAHYLVLAFYEGFNPNFVSEQISAYPISSSVAHGMTYVDVKATMFLFCGVLRRSC